MADKNKVGLTPGYKHKSLLDHALILLGVMTAISLVVIILDILYEVSYLPSIFFDRVAFDAGSRALLDIYQNTFFEEGWARFMTTLLMLSLFTGIGFMIFFYVKDLAVLIREIYKGAYRAARDTGEVLRDTAEQINPFNMDPLTGEQKVKAPKPPKAVKQPKPKNVVDFKAPGEGFNLSEEELNKMLTDPNYVPPKVDGTLKVDKKSLFED
jgi:hypothetical protein